MRLIIPNLPKGVRFDQNGLTFDLADHETVQLLRAAYHQMQVLQGQTMYQDPEIAAVDPAVTDMLSGIFNQQPPHTDKETK